MNKYRVSGAGEATRQAITRHRTPLEAPQRHFYRVAEQIPTEPQKTLKTPYKRLNQSAPICNHWSDRAEATRSPFYAVPYEVIKEPIEAPGRATEARKTPRGIEPHDRTEQRRSDPPGTHEKKAGAEASLKEGRDSRSHRAQNITRTIHKHALHSTLQNHSLYSHSGS